jgi:cold shock CspA family protein
MQWFGGLNNQTKKINNYGFILAFDGEENETIFVHRNNIPVHLQDFLESKNREGVYVQFEIEPTSKGKSAVNVDLLTFVGIVKWFDRGRGHIKRDLIPDVRFTSNESFNSKDILHFGIRYNSQIEQDEAILVQKVNNFTENQEIIQKCIQSDNPDIFLIFLIKYLQNLPVEEAISLVIEKIKLIKNREKIILIYERKINKLIDELFEKTENLFIESSDLRSFLPINESASNSYGRFIDKYINSVDEPLRQELLAELTERLRKASDLQISIYWKQVKYLQQNLEYKGFLWEVAPAERKKALIKDKYKKFFETVYQFNNSDYPYEQATTTDWWDLYNFDEDDKKLIKKWDSNISDNAFTKVKMISARGAEKLVIQFYKTLNYVVEDISIHQVTQESHDWKQGDVRLDSWQLLDVKNARSPINSDVYSEFCVPSFKQYRVNDVKVVGVLSPYVKKEEIDGTNQPKSWHLNQKVSVLGAFDKTKLQELEVLFSDRLIRIDMPRGFSPKAYLPHWLFDYDERFYVKQLEVVAQFQQLQEDDIPSWEDVLTVSQNPLSLFIAAKRKLPQEWLCSLPQWQVEFINSLLNLTTERISLPYVFLSLLRHFLTMLSYENSDYSPQQYQEILYTNSGMTHPLKLYDPLNTIKNFCDTLQSLWEHREQENLTEFKIFKFNGRGLLRGKRSEAERMETTILAYCGGKIEKKKKARCGFTPLVIGKHQTCFTCCRLICPKEDCSHCSDDCRS